MLRPLVRCLPAETSGCLVAGGRGPHRHIASRFRPRAPPAPRSTRGHSRCEDQQASPWSGFRPAFHGQVTPSRALKVADDGEAAPVELQGGPFASRWLRVRRGATADHVLSALDEAELGATTSIYVGIPDDHLQSGAIVSVLRERGFRFHHFHGGSARDSACAPPGELIYYRWAGSTVDMVPSYSTASEGVGVLVLSPEQDEVLLVWEYGHWKVITGSVGAGSSMSSTVRAEVREEVGLELEDTMYLVGGWQEPRARDGLINSVFLNFTAVATSRAFQVDNLEIKTARWFPVSALPSLRDERRAPSVEGKPHSMEVDLGVPGHSLLSRTVAHFLDVHRQGRGLRVTDVELDRDLFF